MRLNRKIIALAFAAGIAFGAQDARAHCDTVDGPVAMAVRQALDSGNVYPVLAYAPAEAEKELIDAFAQARKVRELGPEARALADRAFLETAIRLHRAGEGAAYTGLKPGGVDFGPMIPAAERAVETGDPQAVKAVLMHELDHVLGERLAHIRELQKAPKEPRNAAELAAARARISAELGFVTFAESLRQAVLGKLPAHHED
jgi:hypothetical protein